MNAQYRKFESGATRNLDQHKLDYEAFLCPLDNQRAQEGFVVQLVLV